MLEYDAINNYEITELAIDKISIGLPFCFFAAVPNRWSDTIARPTIMIYKVRSTNVLSRFEVSVCIKALLSFGGFWFVVWFHVQGSSINI